MTAREVELTGGAPWGFRMHGGADQNQPLRISRVNPGRKASLSGIREGDIISSINGNSTRRMSNSDAQALLRSAGPVLRLGLNEDRETSPRRRSIGKESELKRPSQLIPELQSKAIPHAPVYATIRPSQIPQNRSASSSQMRSSLNSLPSALNTTPPVKITTNEDPIKFHPTNPFYTTLPSNYSRASRLPVPNGRASLSSLDRSKSIYKSKDTYSDNSSCSDLKSPTFFTKSFDSGDSKILYSYHDSENMNGSLNSRSTINDKIHDDKYSIINPFYTKSTTNIKTDSFQKYLPSETNINGVYDYGNNSLSNNAKRGNDIDLNEVDTKRSVIMEHKINETEEVKTTKKIIFNGSFDEDDKKFNTPISNGSNRVTNFMCDQRQPPTDSKINMNKTWPKEDSYYNFRESEKNEHTLISPYKSDYSSELNFESDCDKTFNFSNGSEEGFCFSPTTVKAAQIEIVTSKPPVKSPTSPNPQTPLSHNVKPVWRPGAPTPPPAPPSAPAPALSLARSPGAPPPPPPPPVWTPGSAGASPQGSRKSFRPVHFEETPPTRRKFMNSEQNGCTSGSESEGRLRTSHSAPATGLSTLGGAGPTSRLPRAQNPTVTLLQKAREGQLQGRGTSCLQQERDSARLPRDRASPPKSDPVHALRREYASEGEAERSEYIRGGPRTMADAHRKVDGIGPTTKEGMPVALRSEVKDPSRWYKKMYDTIHKSKFDDDYVTIRYKNRRGQPPQRVNNKSQYAYFDPRSGYLSEPEGGLNRLGSSTWSDAYDSDAVSTGPRRRTASVQEDRRNDDVTSPYPPSNKYSTLASARASQEIYRNQPGRIENYTPGRSSVIDKEAKQWWDEVMDIFDGWLDDNSPLPPYSTLLARAIQKNQISNTSTTSLTQASPKEKKDVTSAILAKSNMARALKESGYESDSTLVFRRREDTEAPLSPAERRAAYRELQSGGEPPLRGFRSPAPPRQDESEIEYIPISPTLTKIRIHKKTPTFHEVICYPVTSIEPEIQNKTKKPVSPFAHIEIPTKLTKYPPAPPRRISSRNSRTLQLVSSSTPVLSSIRSASAGTQSNVDRLKDKISHKLRRQNTQIINKRNVEPSSHQKMSKSRVIMSTSAPPAVNRKQLIGNISSNCQHISNMTRKIGTSSFSSPRRTILPADYSNSIHTKYGERSGSTVIDGGVGRKTPISNILDKVTTLDKLWSSEKRNERIDMSKIKAKVTTKPNNLNASMSKLANTKTSSMTSHRGRDMVRTAEKVQKLKFTNACTKSMPYLVTNTESKILKTSNIQTTKGISKSTTNVSGNLKKPNQVKTAIVTNLKKKKSNDNIVMRPRSIPCHESCSKKTKDVNKSQKKTAKTKPHKRVIKMHEELECESQFGDTSNEVSNFGSVENLGKKNIGLKEIKKMHDAIVSDSFFQHLFLGGSCAPTLAYPILEQSSVLQKAKMFQTFPQTTQTAKSLNTYLIHRKPVSLSRFKEWDRYISPTRDKSPRSISWPGRKHTNIKKFYSFTKDDEFGSTSSLNSVRSKSEPPINKIYFSQTSRPKSPTVVFLKKENTRKSPIKMSNKTSGRIFFSQTSCPVFPQVDQKLIKPKIRSNSVSPTRIILTETVRPISPSMIKTSKPKLYLTEITSDEEIQPSTLFFSQTSRPISPKVIMKSRSQSTSPVSIRSPSYRRIHSARLQSSTQPNDTLGKKVYRTRSAGDAEKGNAQYNVAVKTKSVPNLNVNDPDYNEYIRDMENTKARSERFRELNRYYTYLERVSQLEKTTSTCDLRHRKKDEEIIDFDRWKKIRAIERAEEELNILYHKLKLAQSEKDVLFYPRDLDDYRWDYNKDRGLRIKEKSVEDLKEQFQQTSLSYLMDTDRSSSKDTYKPLWRGTSVAETAFNINRQNIEINNNSVTRVKKPSVGFSKDYSLSDLRRKIGIGNHLWSSLSIEQVNALKNQLNAIYSKELETKNSEIQKYAIDVDDTNSTGKSMLHVRSNSLITSDRPALKRNELSKSKSIAAMACPITSIKELKNNVNKIQMTLSENDKRKISQTLSKEVLSRINKPDNSVPLSVNLNSIKEQDKCLSTQYDSNIKDQLSLLTTTSSTEIDNNTDNKYENQIRHVIYPSNHTEAVHQSSASETETASSDASSKTVIYRGPIKQVQKKVEYFESVKQNNNQINTIHHVRNSSDGTEDKDKLVLTPPTNVNKNEVLKNQIVQSQSCANLKELFGESERNKFLSLPLKAEMNSRASSPYSEVNIIEQQLPDTERYSSNETIWRSRSPSPDPERYSRAYFNLARAGEVRRLARRFDSPPSRGPLRRHRSDPEITRSTFHQNWSSIVQEKQKFNMLPVARVPLRSTNRLMPHIDIISKLAALRKRITPRSRSAEEALECRVGEVDRIRRRFEAISLLGQIYASAPDVSELRDIAQYLGGPWIAHRYPKQSDNNRSIQDPCSFVGGRKSPVMKEMKRLAPKESLKLSSILRSDVHAKQEFDPAAHRPASRYVPPRAPPRPPPATWPYCLVPYVMPSRHSVKFKENDMAPPEPPSRAAFGSYSDTESPRRYVESDVNIHYRCPVRHDPLPLVPERELARQQAEHMKRLYREQKRNKYLQENNIRSSDIEAFDAYMKELQDMQNRRHQDNFTPSQKTVVPLNRYDEAERVVAKALYAFNGQTSRELSFRKGDLITVRRQIDANWYEGEVHGRIGLFPYNYIELLKGDAPQSPKKPVAVEGRARAKFDFTAQTNLELPLKKGEVVVLTRRIDQNWWEGRNGNKTGIFPDSYVTVLQEPSQNKPEPHPVQSVPSDKPMASPAAHGLLNGSAKRSMGSHSYTPQPNSPALSNAPQPTQPLPGYMAKPAQATLSASERGYGPPTTPGVDLNNTEPLYVDTNAEAVPFRAMYKYRPQNPDELELNEGDTVYVLEKCDDGWYVGSSQRTGRFGTFPGNYVERI